MPSSDSVPVVRVTAVTPAALSPADLGPFFHTQPAAGFPAPGDDVVEAPLAINDLLVEHPEATFFVRVAGDSMEGAGIFNTDILVVDRVVEPDHRSIVVAAVYGELVVKRLHKTAAGYQLISEHPDYEPINIRDNDDCTIWGVVTGSIRVFR